MHATVEMPRCDYAYMVRVSFPQLFVTKNVVFRNMHNRQEELETDWPVSFRLCPDACAALQATKLLGNAFSVGSSIRFRRRTSWHYTLWYSSMSQDRARRPRRRAAHAAAHTTIPPHLGKVRAYNATRRGWIRRFGTPTRAPPRTCLYF